MSEIVPVKQRAAQMCGLIQDRLEGEIAKMLPRAIGVTPERFMAVTYAAIKMTPALADATPASLMTAIVRAAQAGIEVDGVHGALVPFKEQGTPKAVFIPMYQGLISAALRSGLVASTQIPRLVYDGDRFEYEYGLQERLRHVPLLDASNQTDDNIIAGYFIVTMVSGEKVWEITPRKVFDSTKERSRAKRGPWSTDFASMCMKTTVRRTLKYVAKRAEQAELQRMIARDERLDAGIVDPDLPFGDAAEAKDTLDDLANALDLAEPEALAGAEPEQPDDAEPRF